MTFSVCRANIEQFISIILTLFISFVKTLDQNIISQRKTILRLKVTILCFPCQLLRLKPILLQVIYLLCFLLKLKVLDAKYAIIIYYSQYKLLFSLKILDYPNVETITTF